MTPEQKAFIHGWLIGNHAGFCRGVFGRDNETPTVILGNWAHSHFVDYIKGKAEQQLNDDMKKILENYLLCLIHYGEDYPTQSKQSAEEQ